MLIKTSTCGICGTVVMSDSLTMHLEYVHNDGAGKKSPSIQGKKPSKSLQKKPSPGQGKIEFKLPKKIKKPGFPLSFARPFTVLLPRKKLTCVLCGAVVRYGKMLEHKYLAHGEQKYTSSHTTHKPNQWVRVYQGGLPSLGKRRR